MDESSDAHFYDVDRLVTHIDDAAIAAVGALYAELGLVGRILDLMASWISHFQAPPDDLVVLGMNAAELAANESVEAEEARHAYRSRLRAADMGDVWYGRAGYDRMFNVSGINHAG